MSFFDFVKAPELKKYKYDLSHTIKFSGKIGCLIPFSWEHLSPGDSISLNSQQFIRTAPLVHPIYQRLNVDVHHFFIPLRLIWEDFETFITGFDQSTHEINENVNHPKIILDGSKSTASNYYSLFKGDTFGINAQSYNMGLGSLADYLGVPVQELPEIFGIDMSTSSPGNVHHDASKFSKARVEFSALPFRAYSKVFNDYYRDSIKESEVFIDTSSNDTTITQPQYTSNIYDFFDMRYRALEQDYFTTSQPTPQLGTDVNLMSPEHNIYSMNVTTKPSSPSNLIAQPDGSVKAGSITTGLFARVSPQAITTINNLRELFSVQKWKDTGNKFGSRYKEQVKGHFGVDTPDARLQRPQFLGGGRIPIMINQVSQLSEGTEDSPLGYQAGQGMASGQHNNIEFEAKEHGIIMSIISVLPENTYYRGLPKKFTLFDRFDFPWPEFANLGEQEVINKEYNLQLEGTYGYQERYADFKFIPNRAMGEFRTNLRDFYLASPQNVGACTHASNLRVNPYNFDNVFAISAVESDNIYFLVTQDFFKYSPLPYLNRTTTDYV